MNTARILRKPQIGALLLAMTACAIPTSAKSQEDACWRVLHGGWLGVLNVRDSQLCAVRVKLEAQKNTVYPGAVEPFPAASAERHKPAGEIGKAEPAPAASSPQAGDDYRADLLLNMRSGPGVDHGVVARVSQDDRVRLTGQRLGDWWQVRHTNASRTATGWVFSLWLRRVDER